MNKVSMPDNWDHKGFGVHYCHPTSNDEGTAIRILTGAKIPEGADAVVAREFTTQDKGHVIVMNHTSPCRNIMTKGCDVALNDLVCAKGDRLAPGMVGILAAAGYSEIPVFRRPGVAILATGDEIIIPGRPLPDGKLYASNLAMLNAWCRRYGMNTSMDIVGDKPEVILNKLESAVEAHDAVLTSGGAWTGDRDFVVKMLETLGWKQLFHRIRIGPGKAVGFGLLKQKPVFVLPGGPSSNLLAFLQIALPGLLKLGGYRSPELPRMQVKLEKTVTVRDSDWTQFILGVFNEEDGHTSFEPLELKSRLQSMARAKGVIAVPEGAKEISAGSIVSAQLLV
ncbi:MAG: molybdopterin molybdotransferase MoeA [Dehalococcoidia bacterium]